MAKNANREKRTAKDVTDLEIALLEAQEMFVVQAQVAINRLMREHNVSQADLARRLGVSEARVSSMFANDKNFTLRTIGRILHAMGEEAMLTTAREFQKNEKPADAVFGADVNSSWAVGADEPNDVSKREPRRPRGKVIDLQSFARQDRIYQKRLPALPLAA